MLSSLDWKITLFFNQFAGRYQILDRGMHTIADYMLASSMLFLAVICYLWFRERVHPRPVLQHMLAEFAGAALAGPLSRGLQLVLKFHPRPLHDPSRAFRTPFGVAPGALNHWSSFPSDHAAVYFALAMIIWLHSRRLGVAAWIWAALFCFPRIYLGYHWSSDILGGAIIGILCVLISRALFPRAILSQALEWEKREQGTFYACAFLACYQVGTFFGELRHVAGSFLKIIKIAGF